MYAAHIGRRALAAYNAAHHPEAPLSPREFFLEILWPVAFDHPVYLFHPGNSSIGQLVNQRKTAEPDRRREARDALIEAFMHGVPENHLFMGGYAADPEGSTSGQITGIEIKFPEEDFFCSWIGALCGVEVGGIWMSFDEPKLLLLLVEGWPLYRKYLEETPGLAGNQMNTWNGWWLIHRLTMGEDFTLEDPFLEFSPDLRRTQSGPRLHTIRWTEIVFAVTDRYPSRQLTVFLNALSQTNRTYGIVPLNTPEIDRMGRIWEKYFQPIEGLGSWSVVRRLYESEWGLPFACREGVIGLSPLRPKVFREMFEKEVKIRSRSRASERAKLNSLLGQTWILAMLNDGSMRGRAKNSAQTLIRCARPSDGRATTTNLRLVEEVLKSTNRTALIKALTEVLKAVPAEVEGIQTMLDDLLEVPASDFPLLFALIKFEFEATKAQQL